MTCEELAAEQLDLQSQIQAAELIKNTVESLLSSLNTQLMYNYMNQSELGCMFPSGANAAVAVPPVAPQKAVKPQVRITHFADAAKCQRASLREIVAKYC